MITTVNLEFSVSGQTLTAQQEMPYLLASNTVKYVKAHFELDENWQSVETVSAVWSGIGGCYSTVLDDGVNCFVPPEILGQEQRVYVNLVGSDVDNDEVVDRITTYPVNVINVNATAYTFGSETVPLTPSQFEQYVAIVSDLVHSVKDIDRIELNEDYTLTERGQQHSEHLLEKYSRQPMQASDNTRVTIFKCVIVRCGNITI